MFTLVAGTWAWQNVRTNATTDVFLAELREATWYELKMKACNSAGCGNQSSQFATLDYDGSKSGGAVVVPCLFGFPSGTPAYSHQG